MKHHKQSNLSRKGFFIWFMLPHHCSSIEGSPEELKEGRNLKAGADDPRRPWEECWLALHDLVSFLIETKTTRPEVAPSTRVWAFCHGSLIKKMSYRLACSWSYGGIVSVEASSFPMTLACGQIDIIVVSTMGLVYRKKTGGPLTQSHVGCLHWSGLSAQSQSLLRTQSCLLS